MEWESAEKLAAAARSATWNSLRCFHGCVTGSNVVVNAAAGKS
jgi:hypothetical protein